MITRFNYTEPLNNLREWRTPRTDADALVTVPSGWDTSTPDQILENLETWKNRVQNDKGFLGDPHPLMSDKINTFQQ